MKANLCLLTLLTVHSIFGQTVSSTVQGVVTDPTGALVAGASATLTNQATSQTATVTSFNDGTFRFANAAPGVYSLTIETPGFKALSLRDIVVTAGETRTLGRLALSVGDVKESVSVTAEAASLQLASAERSGLVSGAQLNDIAIKGRDLFGFLSTLPGVLNTTGNGGGSDSAGVGAIGGLSLNGNRNGSTNIAVDGVTNLNTGNNTNLMYEPNMDSIGEVKVLTSNFSAEYGRMGGGQVIIVTKSGSKDFHGSGYDYYRHESLNANDFFNNRTATPETPYRYRVTGYSIGGPVFLPRKFNSNRDKVFFFFSQDYSDTKLNPGVSLVTMPTALERKGDFSQTRDVNGALIVIKDPSTGASFPGNMIPQNRISAAGQGMLNAFPLPNYVDPDPKKLYTANYRTSFSTPYPKRQEVFKTDINLSSTLRMSYRIVNNKDTQSAYYGLSQGKSGNVNFNLAKVGYNVPGKGQVVNITKTFSPTLISETVFGFNNTRSQTDVDPADSDLVARTRWGNLPRLNNDLKPGKNIRVDLKPNLTFTGVSNAPNANMVNLPWYNLNRNWDFTESVSKILSSHQIKFGAYISRIAKSDPTPGVYIGTYDFGRNTNNSLDSNYAYSNAVLGNFNSYTEDSDRPTTFTRMWNIEPFVQDNWKVTSRLTLDYGLRFYHWTTPKDAALRQATFNPPLWDPKIAPVLYQPALVNNVRVARNPLTGATAIAANIGGIVPGSGSLVDGIVIGGKTAPFPRGVEQFPALTLGPRFGFAYDVFGKGTTAIRGGFGLYFDRITSGANLDLGGNPPAIFTYQALQSNVTQVSQATAVNGASTIRGMLGEVKLPAIMNFSLGVQQKLKDTVVDVSYVGGLSRHLYQTRNWNAIPLYAHFNPASQDPTSPGKPLPDSLLVPYPGYGTINLNQPQASANYNSLQVSANRRFTAALQFGISYTFSKALGVTGVTPNGYGAVDPQFTDRNWFYGPLTFDRSHNFVFNYIYMVPKVGARLGWKPLGYVLDNWQLSGITTFQSGSPFTPTFTTVDGQDITGSALTARIVTTGDPNISKGDKTFDRTFNTSVFARPALRTFGNAGVGILRGPGINNWDIAVSKRIPLWSESRYLQFRTEMFNAWNHTQFSGVSTVARFDATGKQVDPNFGAYSSTRPPRVMQLSLRLTF